MSTDRISEIEATSYAGVSAATLKRFADAGYLRIEEDPHGQKYYSRSEFESVFGGAAPIRSQSEEDPYTEHTSTSHEVIIESESFTASDVPVDAEVIQEKTIELKENFAEKILLLEKDVVRLKSLVHLQERLIETKERELDRMSEERNWLRERVEKLDEKSNRDQLILVSVTETNRGLVSAIERRKSPIKAALDWLGLTGDEQTTQAQQH